MEEIEKQEVLDKHIEYHQPKFWHRVVANVIDGLIFVALLVSFFFAFRGISKLTPDYKKMMNRIDTVQVDSGIYKESGGKTVKFTTYIRNNNDMSGYVKCLESEETVAKYLKYMERTLEASDYNEVYQDYESFFLSKKYEGTNYFIKVDNKIVRNIENCHATLDEYYSNVYQKYLDNNAEGFLLSKDKNYYRDVHNLGLLYFAIFLPISFVLAGFLTWFVPPFIFKRGRKTFGKALYHIGVVGPNCLNLSTGRFIARFSIFFFGEICLSIITFGLPILLSFTLMIFSKRHSGFPDFMLNSTAVSTADNKIYLSKEEIEMSDVVNAKKPVDFKMR